MAEVWDAVAAQDADSGPLQAGPPGLPPQAPSQYRVQSEALRGTGTPNSHSIKVRLSRPARQPRPEPRGELPVHYIQVQIIGPRVQHTKALGP